MVVEILLTVGIVTGGWYVAWNWKIKHMPFVRKLLELDKNSPKELDKNSPK